MIIYEEGLSDGWELEVTKGESDLQSTDYAHSGSISHVISFERGAKLNYLFDDSETFSIYYPASILILRFRLVTTYRDQLDSDLDYLSNTLEFRVTAQF